MRFGRWKLAGAILFLYLEGRSGHQVLPPLMHLSLIYRLPRLPWGSSWAARPARLCLLLQLLCLPGTAHV